jgi:hypothetical protein
MSDYDRFDEVFAVFFLRLTDALHIEWMLRKMTQGLVWLNEKSARALNRLMRLTPLD